MAKTREIQCVSYVCEGTCSKGREGTFYKYCQKCDKYSAKRGSKPNRTDTRGQRKARAERKEDRL